MPNSYSASFTKAASHTREECQQLLPYEYDYGCALFINGWCLGHRFPQIQLKKKKKDGGDDNIRN